MASNSTIESTRLKSRSWADDSSSSESESEATKEIPIPIDIRPETRFMKTDSGETVKVIVGAGRDVPYKCYFTEALRLFRIILDKEEKRETIHANTRIQLGKHLQKIQEAFFHSQEMIRGEREMLKWNQTEETYPDIVRKLFFLPPDEKHPHWHLIKPYGYYINSRGIKVLSLTPIVRKQFERILADESLTKEVEIFNRYIQRKLS